MPLSNLNAKIYGSKKTLCTAVKPCFTGKTGHLNI